MADSTKIRSEYDQTQIIQKVYSSADAALTTSTFLAAQVSNRVDVAYPTSSTKTYSFYEGSNLKYVLTLTYTDSTKANLSSVERTT